MVSAVRHGLSMREVARRFHVCLRTVQFWCQRASHRRLDRVDFADGPSGPARPANRCPDALEELVLSIRRDLKGGPLGEHAAVAIRRALRERRHRPCPSVRTIGRILVRHGLLDHRRRRRWPAPPRGWYLPCLQQQHAELDSFDVIEDLKIENGPLLDVLTGHSLWGGLPAAWPHPGTSASFALDCLLAHWRAWGSPHYVQFDNDPRFLGPQNHPNVLGRVPRACLSLGVVPVFVPPSEFGFQSQIESFNGRRQRLVWTRFHHASPLSLHDTSERFLQARRERSTFGRETGPSRRPFPNHWVLNLSARPRGLIIFLRRTNQLGEISFLGHRILIDAHWPHRLVRAEVLLHQNRLRCFALRRRTPTDQPLLNDLIFHFNFCEKVH